MARQKDRTVLKHLHTLFDVGTIRDLTDGQLLERFAIEPGERAELAFSVLVERHGPMVLRVCRGVLTDPHDTQDVFQATFLVLVQKAGSLWVHDSLGPWLHQVAYRTACQARSAAARRRRHEQKVAERTSEARTTEADDELGRLLHEEINRLPEHYRAPLVLCDLGGRSHEQAARHLGWPVGTVKSRLSRGRERLRDRLRRRGLAPDSGLIAAALRPAGPEASVPPALAESATRAAVQSALTRTVLAGSAAALAKGVLRTMYVTQGLKVASILLAVTAAVSSAPLVAQVGASRGTAQPDGAPGANAADDTPVFEVKAGKIQFNLNQSGVVEASSNQDVFSTVEGQTTVLSLVPEGTRVQKGQLVGELDSAQLKDRLMQQEVVIRAAEAAYQNASLARQVAEVAVVEYTDGIYPQQRMAAQGEVSRTRAAMEHADGRLKRTLRARKELNEVLAEKRAKTPGDVMVDLRLDDRVQAAEAALDRGKLAFEIAHSKMNVLEKFTHDKTVKELKSEVEKARSDELAKKQAWQLEQLKGDKLRTQIEDCRLTAPTDGTVVYASNPSRTGGQPATIQEGVTVRERQKIFSIPDLNKPFRVRTHVLQPWVNQIRLGQPVRITASAFAGEPLTGEVEDVAPLPDAPANSGGAKFYTVRIKLNKATTVCRPGMAVDAEILANDHNTVLGVPPQAVLQEKGKHYVAVKKPGGSFEWRAVTVMRRSMHENIEIKEGVKSGESVALDAAGLRNAELNRNPFGAPTLPSRNPDQR